MSNAGRPRTGFKPCPFCASKERASNGQCACRNSLYRLTKAATSDSMAKKVAVLFNGAVKSGDATKAVARVREEFPSLARTKTAPTKKALAKKTEADKRAARVAAKENKKNADVAAKDKAAHADVTVDALLDGPASKPERYVLNILDDFTDPKPYARKDAAVKNGVRSGEDWNVTYKGKVVAASDDLL